MADWLLDHLMGMKRGEQDAAVVDVLPVIGPVVSEVNSIAGLIPTKITTTTITSADPAVAAYLQGAETKIFTAFNAELTSVGATPLEEAAFDARMRTILGLPPVATAEAAARPSASFPGISQDSETDGSVTGSGG